MKRLLSLSLALILLLSLAAAAEPAPVLETTYTAFTHPRQGYTVEYPSTWALFDKDGMQQVKENIEAGKTDLPETAVNMFSVAMGQIDLADLAMVVDPVGNGHNFNTVVNAASPTPPIDAVLKELPPLLKQQYAQMYPNIQWEDEGSLAKVGGVDALRARYSFAADPLTYTQTQYFVFAGGQQYTLTFTWISPTETELVQLEAHMAHMIDTFTVPQS